MNIFIIFFGCLIISIVLILVFRKKKTSGSGFCTPDTKSCNQWTNVKSAFIPCIEGVNQKCGDTGICPDGTVCAGDGCCVACKNTQDWPDSKNKTCGEDTSGCIVQPENLDSGGSVYTCSCGDANTDLKNCNNLVVSYLDNNGNSVPLQNMSEKSLQEICGINYMKLPSGPQDSLSSVVRTCYVDTSKNTGTEYSSFTCNTGYNVDKTSYSCTSGTGSNCIPNDPKAPPPCSSDEKSTNAFCPITDYNTVEYCKGLGVGSTDCLKQRGTPGSTYFVGHKLCVSNGSGGGNLTDKCYPCCDTEKGWEVSDDKTQCINKCVWPYFYYKPTGSDKGHCIFYDPITSGGEGCTTPFQTGVANNNIFPITNTVANCTSNFGVCDGDVEQTISNTYGPGGANYGKPFHISQFDWRRVTDNNENYWCTDTGFIEEEKWYCRPLSNAINPVFPYNTQTPPKWTYCDQNSPDYVTITDKDGKSVSGCVWNGPASRGYMSGLPVNQNVTQWNWYGGQSSQGRWTPDASTQIGDNGQGPYGAVPTSTPPTVFGNVITEGTGLYTPTQGCSLKDFDNIVNGK
jgi:hypothetical protein